jgi:hypothetical protein
MASGANPIERLRPSFTDFRIKLERLSLASLFSLVKCLRVRLEPIRVKLHSRVGSWRHPQTLD